MNFLIFAFYELKPDVDELYKFFLLSDIKGKVKPYYYFRVGLIVLETPCTNSCSF